MKSYSSTHRAAWLLITSTAAFLIGCSNHDKAMPLDADNAKELFQAIQTRMGSVSNQDDPAATIKVVYAAIEEDMGYSFDLTIRYKQFLADQNSVYGLGVLDNLLMSTQQYIFENTDTALKNQWISQRTYDLVQADKKSVYLYPDDEKLIAAVEICQSNHSGVCHLPDLFETLKQNNMIEEKSPTEDLWVYYANVEGVLMGFGLERLINSGIITKTDGEKLNPNAFVMEDNKHAFIVNKDLMERSLQFKQMIEEEKKFFNLTPTKQS